MMQTREDLESWQKEVQKRLDAEAKYVTELQCQQTQSMSHSGYSSGPSGYSSGSNQSEDDDKERYLYFTYLILIVY